MIRTRRYDRVHDTKGGIPSANLSIQAGLLSVPKKRREETSECRGKSINNARCLRGFPS